MAYKITDECIACGSCMDECPVEAISEGDIYVIDAATCTDCGACAEQCPVEAIVQDQLEVLRKGTFQIFWKVPLTWHCFKTDFILWCQIIRYRGKYIFKK